MQKEHGKLRGLFIIKVDDAFDNRHPLWETMQSYKTLLEETHVLIFSRSRVPKREAITKPENDFFLYRCSSRHLLFHFLDIWKLLSFELYWRKAFRADFVVSFSPGRGGLFGYLIARRFKRSYFLVAAVRMAQGSTLSLKRKVARFLIQHATTVFVPGSQNALALSKLLNIPPAKLVPLEPAVDMMTVIHTNERKDYHLGHPQYNFFLSATAASIEMLRELVLIHARVAAKYPRVALIALVPRGLQKRSERFIRRSKSFGVFVYPQSDALLFELAGSHVYVGINESDEADTVLLSALALGLPTVAYRSGMAQELFANTPYERFASDPRDTAAAATLVIELIEHQATRNGYAVNTGILFKKFSRRDTASYVRAMHDTVQRVVTPPKAGISAGVMYLEHLNDTKGEENKK